MLQVLEEVITVNHNLSEEQRTRIREAFRRYSREELTEKLFPLIRSGKVSVEYLSQISNGHTKVSALRAKQIEKLVGIPASILRPDIFSDAI